MAYTPSITWNDGDTITETKLDQMVANIEYVYDYRIPSGAILLWSGSIGSIPSGWFLCDGNNGTPNLTDRFVLGAGNTYLVNDTGGSETLNLEHSHTVASHTHSIVSNGLTTNSSGSHTHTYSGTTSYEDDTKSVTDDGDDQDDVTDNTHRHTYSGTTSNSGSHTHTINAHNHGGSTGSANPGTDNQLSSTASILPKYYALAYIMKS